MKIQSYGVSQPRNQEAVVTFVKVNFSDLVSDREDDEGLEGIWKQEMT